MIVGISLLGLGLVYYLLLKPKSSRGYIGSYGLPPRRFENGSAAPRPKPLVSHMEARVIS